MSDALVTEMRGWLTDCGADVSELPDASVIALVDRHYEGGRAAFARACQF